MSDLLGRMFESKETICSKVRGWMLYTLENETREVGMRRMSNVVVCIVLKSWQRVSVKLDE